MKIGLFGGTFDPIHNGHMHLLRTAREELNLNRIIVMPAGHPYHKNHRVSMMTYRYGMCRAALKHESYAELSDLEMIRRGPSYTLKTVQEIRRGLAQEDELYLICGLDVILQIHLWYEVAELLRIMKVAAFVRPGVDLSESIAAAAKLREQFSADIQIIESAVFDISSSALRETILDISEGHSAYIPDAVMRFIHKHKLYQKEQVLDVLDTGTINKLAEYESILYRQISLKRLLHSLDTMYYAIELALRFDVDPNRAAIAALVHDVARETDADVLWELVQGSVPERWKGSTDMLHAAGGARMLSELFGINDPEIINAVALHTTLDRDPSDLEKLIFVADKSEPGRQYDDLGPIRHLAKINLNQATLACLEAVERYAAKRGFTHEPLSQAALQTLQKLDTDKSKDIL